MERDAAREEGGVRHSHQHGAELQLRPLEQGAIVAMLGAIPWLAREPTDRLVMLSRRAQHRVVSRYTAICREGGAGRHFFVLLDGTVACSSALLKVDIELRAGDFFGESILMGEKARRATVVALSPCRLLQMSADDVREAAIDLTELRTGYLMQLLASNSIFSSLPQDKLLRPLAGLMSIRLFQAGELIFNEGDPGDHLYLLIQGRVIFFKRIKNREPQIDLDGARTRRISRHKSIDSAKVNEARMVAGQCSVRKAERGTPPTHIEMPVGECTPHSPRPIFGELALWDSKPRQAGARCVEPTKVLVVPAQHFGVFMALLPDMEALFAVGQASYARLMFNSRRTF